MKPSPFRCGVVVLLLLAGCDHDCFEIEVRPAGQAFQRKLTCWHVGDNDAELSSLSAEKLQRLGRLYSTRETPPATVKQVFSGQFTDRPPADVGGAGSYRHLSSPLGGTSWYVERFRGNDDLESRLAKRRQAADKSTDLLVGWLGAELGHDHNFPALKKFLAEDFRRDLTNLGLYQFAGDVTSECEKGSDNEFLVRAGLYLCERGYFSPKDIPILVRADDRRLAAGATARPAAAGQKDGHCRQPAAPRLAGVPRRSSQAEGLAGEIHPLHGCLSKAVGQMEILPS